MGYWSQVLEEVLNQQRPQRPMLLTNISNKNMVVTCMGEKKKEKMCRVPLGKKFPNIYFTRREAECVKLLLKGKTMKGSAVDLRISLRTVEFYIKNIKKKLSCHSRTELIEKVMESDFTKYFSLF